MAGMWDAEPLGEKLESELSEDFSLLGIYISIGPG